MDKEIFDGFYEQLPVKTRRGRGGNYPYVSADDVTHRMNTIFKGNWSTMVTFQDFIEGQIIVRVRVEVTDPKTSIVYSHEGFGGHSPSTADEAGNGFKSAYSKALVNACRRWGVGLFLSDDEAPEVISNTGPSVPAPVAQTKVSAPSEFITTPSKSKTSMPVIPKPPVVTETATITQTMPKIPIPGSKPSVPTSSAPPEIASSVRKTISSMPKIPTQATSIISQSTEDTSEPGVDQVSDVQLLAIQSLVDTRGFKYEDLAVPVLGEVRDVNTLTHDEAVAVIQYGNRLYRESKQR